MGRRRLTHKEFLERFYEKNPYANDIEILGEYQSSKTKIECKCKIDGHEWTPTPNDLLNGSGCPKCSGNIKKTHEEFMKEMNEINPNIEILGEYVNAHTKIECKCKIDGHEWSVTPNSLLSGQGCPKCYGNIKKTHEEFMKDFYEKNSHANDIEILGEYVNNYTKIKCRCKIDGHEWSVTPNSLLSHDYGCPQCCGNIKKTHEEFMKDFYEKNSHANDIEILGEYVNNYTKIKCRCKIDGHEWTPTPNGLLNHSYGCPKCYGNIKKTHEEFMKEMNEINPNIEILGEYLGALTPIECKCKIDGHEWTPTPNSLLNGQGCPKCNSSKGEKAISDYLQKNNIEFIPQYKFENCKHKNTLPFDFYLPNLNIAIEYDGIQHFEVVEYFGGLDVFIDTKIRDTIKNIYCKDNNIKLIRIPYWEFENIETILDRELDL